MLAITQADHARLAGAIADSWGNERAWSPPPWRELVAATRRHDDGWIAWDEAPTLNERGSPHDFITVPTPERLEIYRRGVEVMRDEHPHAQLLVSMHLVGLFLGRLVPGASKLIESLQGRDRELVEKFIAEQGVWHEEAPNGMAASDLLAQYRLLQAFDQISLILCLNPPDRPSSTTLSYVPLSAPGSSLAPVEVRTEGNRATLDPYPLASDQVELSIEGKVLPDQTFEDVEVYRRALAGAEVEELVFTLSA